MDNLPSLPRLPLIPERILRQHKVFEQFDNRFRACARLLQALWREDKGLPIGTYTSIDGTQRKLGSRITNAAGRAGGNFLTPAVAYLVRREVAYREIGALIDESRLYTNLLSSMPLVFNAFGPLALDLDLATRVIRIIAPDLEDAQVRAVWFEHSPGRGAPGLTGDGTAFDAFIKYETIQGQAGFIAIEMKYSETMTEPAPRLKPRLTELAQISGLFTEPNSSTLRSPSCQQFWREHLLAQAMLLRGDYAEGRLIAIAPTLNHLVQAAIAQYQTNLIEPAHNQAGFIGMSLERLIEAIAHAGQPNYARALFRRYCDWMLVDGEIELALAELNERAVQPEPSGTGNLRLIAGGRA